MWTQGSLHPECHRRLPSPPGAPHPPQPLFEHWHCAKPFWSANVVTGNPTGAAPKQCRRSLMQCPSPRPPGQDISGHLVWESWTTSSFFCWCRTMINDKHPVFQCWDSHNGNVTHWIFCAWCNGNPCQWPQGQNIWNRLVKKTASSFLTDAMPLPRTMINDTKNVFEFKIMVIAMANKR